MFEPIEATAALNWSPARYGRTLNRKRDNSSVVVSRASLGLQYRRRTRCNAMARPGYSLVGRRHHPEWIPCQDLNHAGDTLRLEASESAQL